MKIIENAKMSDYLWYKIGGIAKFLIQCESQKDILEAFKFIKKESLPASKAGIEKYFVAGLGSNLLFTDEYYDGAVVQISSEDSSQIKLINENTIEAFAGATLDSVVRFAFDNNLVGLEWAGGLPGTVGAAVRGNIGAFGGEIKDIFSGAEVLDTSTSHLEIKNLNKRDVRFSYRSSTVKKNHNMVVLSVLFTLEKANDAKTSRARQVYLTNISYRNNKHPMDLPSTGSSFKNINNPAEIEKILAVFPDIEQEIKIKWHGKVSMGYLNKRLDLSGLQIGMAQISNKHSNFIVNLGGATFSDVKNIIDKIQKTFQEVFGFTPEPEVEIVA